SVLPRAEDRVGDRNVLGGTRLGERNGGLPSDAVVPRLDIAVRDSHIPRTVRMHSFGELIEDRNPVDVYVLTSEHANRVIRSVPQRDIPNLNLPTVLQGNRLRPASLRPVSVD